MSFFTAKDVVFHFWPYLVLSICPLTSQMNSTKKPISEGFFTILESVRFAGTFYQKFSRISRIFFCFSGRLHRRKVGIPFFRDLASHPRGVEKGTSLSLVLMVGMNK